MFDSFFIFYKYIDYYLFLCIFLLLDCGFFGERDFIIYVIYLVIGNIFDFGEDNKFLFF